MYLLLDIDGVMVPANSWRRPEILDDGFPAFTAKAVNALNKIISYSQAEIILTTSHKYSYSLKEWREIFKTRQIRIFNISRLSQNHEYLNRKDEILKWLSTNPNEQFFLIIDDDKSLNSLTPELKNKLIQTSASVGLTNQHADEAIEKIEKHLVQYS